MGFEGWLIKFGGTAVPNAYLEQYRDTPNQRIELDAYRDASVLLHRETAADYKTKIILPIRRLQYGEKLVLKAILDSGTIDSSCKRERKVAADYWNNEDMDYRSGIFYMPDIEYVITHVDERRLNMVYEAFEIHLIEY